MRPRLRMGCCSVPVKGAYDLECCREWVWTLDGVPVDRELVERVGLWLEAVAE